MNLNKIMEQVTKLQEDLARAQSARAEARVEGSSGGGAVKAVVSGNGELVDLVISPDVLETGDLELLQDMVVAAVRDAQSRARAEWEEQVQELTGGLSIPGLPGMLGF